MLWLVNMVNDMKILNVKLMGIDRPINIIDKLDFNWELKDVKEQLKYIIDIFDDNDNLIIHKEENTNRQSSNFYATFLPLTHYHYNLTVVSKDNQETISQDFYTGLVNGFDKEAKWINDGSKIKDDGKIGSKAIYLYKEVIIDKKVDNAFVNMAGIGIHVLYINNKKVDDRVLEPAFTNYDKTVLYSTYEISKYLKIGKNKILVVLGDGWYNQTTKDIWDFYKASFRNTPRLLFQLDFDNKRIISDKSWKYYYGNIVSNALRTGETHDFNFKTRKRKIKVVKAPKGKLMPSYIEPIRECDNIKPSILFENDKYVVYDFHKNMSGYIKAKFIGKKGDIVTISYSDRINEDGTVDNKSNSMYIFNEDVKYQVDTCILSGKVDTFIPLFVYHGFRYVSITKTAIIKDISGLFVHTDLRKTGYFKADDQILNQLFDMSIQAILSNFVGIPTDCPHREKNGWTGDAQLSLEPSIYSFNMENAYLKWLDDIVDSQRKNGQIPAIIPTSSWGYDWGSGPCWDVAFFRVVEALYDYYGNLEAVKKYYPYLVKYFNYEKTHEVNNLVENGLGDWNYPKNITFKISPTKLNASCYYYYMALTLAKFSKLLGLDPKKYENKAKLIGKAIIDNFKDEDSLTGMATLTYFNILDRSNDIIKYLEDNNYAIHSGILGIKYLMNVLYKNSRVDVGLKILKRKEYPSFRYWIDNNQTALCEDFELTNSLNHHMFSPVIEFMYRGLLGINVKDGCVLLKPHPYTLKHLEGEFRFNNGKYHLAYNDNVLVMNVPANGKIIYQNKIYYQGKHILKLGDNNDA